MHVIVAAGGDPLAEKWHLDIPADAIFIAADSGLAHIYALGRVPTIVVGDLDSVDDADLARARREGTRIDRYPADKDATDLELALAAARELGAARVTVIGAGGGRLDHALANITLLAHPAWSEMRVDALIGAARVTVIRDHAPIDGGIGTLVTLLAVNGRANGVTTTGLRWALQDEDLDAASTRGVSNEIVAAHASVVVRSGVLLAIQPTGGH